MQRRVIVIGRVSPNTRSHGRMRFPSFNTRGASASMLAVALAMLAPGQTLAQPSAADPLKILGFFSPDYDSTYGAGCAAIAKPLGLERLIIQLRTDQSTAPDRFKLTTRAAAGSDGLYYGSFSQAESDFVLSFPDIGVTLQGHRFEVSHKEGDTVVQDRDGLLVTVRHGSDSGVCDFEEEEEGGF
jgi:hypothetical protein